MSVKLVEFVADFAVGLKIADAKFPRAANARTKVFFKPGIGPHSESQGIELVASELRAKHLEKYENKLFTRVPYPSENRQQCDLCLGQKPQWDWCIEVKMLRFLGDNGKVNDNILMHILSPYSKHRSALTDCTKLIDSGFEGKKAILIYGYDHEEWPLDPAINSFEILAGTSVKLGKRYTAHFCNLIHPVHKEGRVFGWEIKALGS